MSRFTSILGADRRRMLSAVGAETVGELIASIPAGSRLERALDLPEAASELELVREAEADLAFLRKGDKLSFTLQAIPGKTFNGIISFIDPILDKTTRTAINLRIDAHYLTFHIK